MILNSSVSQLPHWVEEKTQRSFVWLSVSVLNQRLSKRQIKANEHKQASPLLLLWLFLALFNKRSDHPTTSRKLPLFSQLPLCDGLLTHPGTRLDNVSYWTVLFKSGILQNNIPANYMLNYTTQIVVLVL